MRLTIRAASVGSLVSRSGTAVTDSFESNFSDSDSSSSSDSEGEVDQPIQVSDDVDEVSDDLGEVSDTELKIKYKQLVEQQIA